MSFPLSRGRIHKDLLSARNRTRPFPKLLPKRICGGNCAVCKYNSSSSCPHGEKRMTNCMFLSSSAALLSASIATRWCCNFLGLVNSGGRIQAIVPKCVRRSFCFAFWGKIAQSGFWGQEVSCFASALQKTPKS